MISYRLIRLLALQYPIRIETSHEQRRQESNDTTGNGSQNTPQHRETVRERDLDFGQNMWRKRGKLWDESVHDGGLLWDRVDKRSRKLKIVRGQ